MWAWVLWLGVACAPKKPSAAQVETPILPAPEASWYAVGESVPKDPLVQRVVDAGPIPWDEALSGAAGAVALEFDRPLDLSWVQWAAWRAGYPHPVTKILEGTELADVEPDGLADAVMAQTQMGNHVGLTRARSLTGDRWIALVGQPGMLLEPVPRFVDVGQRVQVTPDRAAKLTVRAPDGTTERLEAPAELRLEQAGQWWFAVLSPSDPERVWATFPVEAGGHPSPTGPIDLPGASVVGPDDARAEAYALVDDLRKFHGLPLLSVDETLETLAKQPLEKVTAGSWIAEEGEARLQGAGFVGGPVAQAWCQGATVAACVDGLATRPLGWSSVLDPQLRVIGVDARVETAGVTLVLNLASE